MIPRASLIPHSPKLSQPLGLSKQPLSTLPSTPSRSPTIQPKATDNLIPFQKSPIEKFSDFFCNLFPVWLAISAAVALYQPSTFTWIATDSFTALLAALMFSMGITMTFDDIKRVLTKPAPVAVNFLACYAAMPLLALAIGKLFGIEAALVAGLVLVGATNGGQASNLCTYIAGGDVALSVLMTTSTTLGCIFMTPLLCKQLLGAVVPVDAAGIAMSAVQVVLLPILAGATLNTIAYKFCRKVEPFCPIIGTLSTIMLVGASVAGCASIIIGAGWVLQVACMLLHLVGGIMGYGMCRMLSFDERTSRTTAIETSMKSSAFSYLLATLHFGDPIVKATPAVSVVWMAIMGSILAVYWKGQPIKPGL